MTRARDTSEIFLGPVAIQSGGTSIGEVNTINFVGTGNTFAVSGTSVDVSIEGGGGTTAGVIGELGLYNKTLTVSEVNQVIDYLTSKWSIS